MKKTQGMLNKKWIGVAIQTAVRECSVEAYQQESTDELLNYFFPKEDINQVDRCLSVSVDCSYHHTKQLSQEIVSFIIWS